MHIMTVPQSVVRDFSTDTNGTNGTAAEREGKRGRESGSGARVPGGKVRVRSESGLDKNGRFPFYARQRHQKKIMRAACAVTEKIYADIISIISQSPNQANALRARRDVPSVAFMGRMVTDLMTI